jgi:hypothetical protein
VSLIDGHLDVNQSFVKKTGGNVDPPDDIRTHPSPTSFPQLRAYRYEHTIAFAWDAVAGASDQKLYSTSDLTVDFPGTAETSTTVSPTSAFVTGIADTSAARWYALSPLIGGVPDLSHPLVAPSTGTLYPRIDSARPCASTTASVTLTDPFFDLASYTISAGETVVQSATFGTGSHAESFTVAVDQTSPPPSGGYELEVHNANGDVATTTIDAGLCSAPELVAAQPPAEAPAASPFSYTFEASGVPTPVFSVFSGALPPGLSLSASGLLSGTPSQVGTFTFVVRAANSIGSVTSAPLTMSIIATAPGAPTIIRNAIAGDSQAVVSWTAPTSNGGSAITGYVVTPYVGLSPRSSQTFTSTATTQTVTGLVNGTQYRFRVRAINAIGTSAYSTVTNPVIPAA